MATNTNNSGPRSSRSPEFDPDAVRDAAERIPTLVNRDDPTGTTDIREEWIDDFDDRWLSVMERVVYAIVDDDAFGLESHTDHSDRRVSAWGNYYTDSTRPEPVRFTGSRGEQLAQFRTWLSDAIDTHVVKPMGDSGILDGQHWTADYLRRSELSGVQSAEQVITAAGFDVDDHLDASALFDPRNTFTGTGPVSRDRWFYETYQEIRGIADATVQQAVREVSDALQGPEETRPTSEDLAEAVIGRLDAIGQSRTQTTVLNFTVELHNNARLARFKRAGFTHVVGLAERSSDDGDSDRQRGNAHDHDHSQIHSQAINTNQIRFTDWSERDTSVDPDPDPDPIPTPDQPAGESVFAEIQTAGDQYVCQDCEAIEGDVYPIEEAFAVLPVHLGCRCSWFLLPTLTSESEPGTDYTNQSHPA